MLSDVPIFQGIPEEGLAHLASEGQRRLFLAGSVLMRQGDPSDCMHVILRGRVEVSRGHRDLTEQLVLATLGPGETVGELGVLDGEPRSATVTALEETHTMEFSAAQVAETILQYPETTRILFRTVSWRLRNTDELATEIARRNQAPQKGGGD